MYYININYRSDKEIEYEERLKKLKEKWKTIKIDDIEFNYEVSNTGKVRNKTNGKILAEHQNQKHYIRISLSYKNRRFTISVHRLVAMHFIPIPKKYIKRGFSFNDLVPNHLDGIKSHNAAFNLEWTTIKDNTIHAFDNGLADTSLGENSHLAKMTNAQAIRACELLEQGWSTSEIAKELDVSKKSIQHIKSGECWTRLSKNYNFARIGKSVPYSFNDKIIHKICKDLEKKKYTDRELSEKYGVSSGYIGDIRTHKRRTNISKDYNF